MSISASSPSAATVLSIGEVLIDLTEDTQTAGSFAAHPGGSPLNIAVGVARLGVPVALASAFGADGFASLLREFLTSEGIDLSLSPVATDQTTLAVAVLVNGEPRYSFYAAHPPAGSFDVAAAAIDRNFAVVHAGSIGLFEPEVRAVALAAFQDRTGLATLDPNVRPSLVTDWESYRGQIRELAVLADLVKVSVEDIEELSPGTSPADYAADLIAAGTKAVVVTAAGDGVTVYTADLATTVPIAGLPVRDTTGGGDSVMATLLSHLSANGLPADESAWTELLERAMLVAGIVCSRPGGAESMPTAAELAEVSAARTQ